MAKLSPSVYFKDAIKDNTFQAHQLSDYIELNEDFNCNTSGKWRNSIFEIRKNSLNHFLNGLREKIDTIDLKKINITYLISDGEFEFNQDQKILDIYNNKFENFKISTSNVIGTINYLGKQVNINCRFGNNFLEYMIANTSGFLELENWGAQSKLKGLGEWILLLYWKNNLKRAFAQGIYKTYAENREELNTIRGSIDINAYINKSYFNGKTTCTFKEHCYSNQINYIISQAIKKIARSRYATLLDDVYEIKRSYDGITFNIPQLRNTETKVINSYYYRYNEVFELSQKILRDDFLSINDSNNEFSAFMFDVSLLFEHHIRKLLSQKFDLFSKNRIEFRIPNGIGYSKLIPDIIIPFQNNEIALYDVKYKNFQTFGANPGVLREDRFQLISYLAYYSSRYKIKQCGIIYPCNVEEYEALDKTLNQEQFVEIGESIIPIKIHFYKVENNLNHQHKFDNYFINQFTMMDNGKYEKVEDFESSLSLWSN